MTQDRSADITLELATLWHSARESFKATEDQRCSYYYTGRMTAIEDAAHTAQVWSAFKAAISPAKPTSETHIPQP